MRPWLFPRHWFVGSSFVSASWWVRKLYTSFFFGSAVGNIWFGPGKLLKAGVFLNFFWAVSFQLSFEKLCQLMLTAYASRPLFLEFSVWALVELFP